MLEGGGRGSGVGLELELEMRLSERGGFGVCLSDVSQGRRKGCRHGMGKHGKRWHGLACIRVLRVLLTPRGAACGLACRSL
jgi:hypothetical protein